MSFGRGPREGLLLLLRALRVPGIGGLRRGGGDEDEDMAKSLNRPRLSDSQGYVEEEKRILWPKSQTG